MKIVKNCCYGGFGLSPKAMKRIAELQGKECYFFEGFNNYREISLQEAEEKGLFWNCFSVKKPEEYLGKEKKDKDGTYTTYNQKWEKIEINDFREDRSNPILVQVVKELGDDANDRLAKLEVIEIPDGIEWEIDDYDGIETIRENHRTW
jgi:hypothetical protein